MSDNEYVLADYYVAKLWVCPRCEGTGRALQSYNPEHYEILPCDKCDGVGRLPEWVPLTEALIKSLLDND